MVVYLLPVLIVSIILIAFVIIYVMLQRNSLNELQDAFPESLAANMTDTTPVQTTVKSVREPVETLPEDDSGEPYVPDMSEDEDIFTDDDSDNDDDIPEDLPWDE